jgi:hypothetical protein
MYARILWRWKERQAKAEWQSLMVKFGALGLVTALMFVFLVLIPAVRWIYFYRSAMQQPSNVNADQLSRVLETRNDLARTFILRPIGDRMLRNYLARLSSISALQGDSATAISYNLLALAASGVPASPSAVEALLGPARYLKATVEVGGDQFKDRATDAIVVKDGASDVLLIGTVDGRILRKQLGTDTPPATLPVADRVISFSPDGRRALVATAQEDGAILFAEVDALDGTKLPGLSERVSGESGGQSGSELITFGFATGTYSPDGNQIALTLKDRAVVLAKSDAGSWRQWTVPPGEERRPIVHAAINGRWLALATADLSSSQTAAPPSSVVEWWSLAEPEPTRRKELAPCAIPSGAPLILLDSGKWLGLCDGVLMWIPPGNGKKEMQAQPRLPSEAFSQGRPATVSAIPAASAPQALGVAPIAQAVDVARRQIYWTDPSRA